MDISREPHNPRVFIGMLVYNGEEFLREAIDSIRSQTYTNWQMVLSDDVSTDKSPEICEEYANLDPRIRYVRQEKLGMIGNYKYLLDHAEGDLFMWAAQDDIWEPDFIRACVDNLEKYPDRGVAFTTSAVINSKGEHLGTYRTLPSLSGPACGATTYRYLNQPEVLGKALCLYGIYTLPAARTAWHYAPPHIQFAHDATYCLAAIARYGLIIDTRILFKKRLGGFSGPHEKHATNKRIDPRDNRIPIGGGRFTLFLSSVRKALADTPYQLIGSLIVCKRAIPSALRHLATRNYKKLFFK